MSKAAAAAEVTYVSPAAVEVTWVPPSLESPRCLSVGVT